MDQIIIGFSRPSGWFEPFSWLIRLVTRSPYSHVYIKYYNPYANRWEIFQASGLKVNFVGQALFNSQEIIYKEFVIPVSAQTKLATVQFAIDNVGKPYGIGQIAGIGWVLLMRVFGKRVANPFYSGSSYFCSEVTEAWMNEIARQDDPMEIGTADPTDICNFLESKGFQTTME